MKNIEKRLTAVERVAAKSMAVTVRFINSGKDKDIDLLQAVRLLLSRKIQSINLHLTEAERLTGMNATIEYIRRYMDGEIELDETERNEVK